MCNNALPPAGDPHKRRLTSFRGASSATNRLAGRVNGDISCQGHCIGLGHAVIVMESDLQAYQNDAGAASSAHKPLAEG